MKKRQKDKIQTSKKRFKKRLADSKYLLLMISPCVLYFIIFKYWPMFGLVTSFQDYSPFKDVLCK